MTTTPTLKLVRGNKSIDLSTSPYAMGKDFEIPSLSTSEVLSNGSSANVYRGSIRTSIKYNSRKWSFSVRVNSTTDAAVRLAIRDISQFLFGINDNEVTYIEYRVNSDTPEPLWGTYGTAQRYEVISGSTSVWPEYSIKDTRSRSATVTINLTIGPFALGRKMQICSATGGVLNDTFARAAGDSLGLIVGAAATNYIPNPSFENSTYLSGWTLYSAATTIEAQETSITLDGLNAYRVTSKSTADAAGRYADISGLSAGSTYTFSAWVYLLSGQANLYAFDGGAYTNGVTSATSTQNQWTRLQVSKVCPAGGSIRVFLYLPANSASIKNSAIYDAVQLELGSAATPYFDGDKLGCAWSGTLHASTSTRTAASCKVPIANAINRGCGTIRVIYKFAQGVAAVATQRLLTLDNTGNFEAQYQSSTQILFQDGSGSSVTGTISAPTAGQIDVLHFVYGDAGMIIYRNGAALNNATAYIAPNDGTYLYIGSSTAAASQGCGTFIDFSTFADDLTATQVANDYANLSSAITNSEKIGSIPWFYTDDGDNILSLDTGKKPLGVVGGVPGSAPAITEIQGALSSNWSTIKSIALSNYACDAYIGLGTLLYDYDGTAAAGDYGGKHLTTTVNGSGIVLSPANPVLSSFIANQINGMEFYIFTRLYGSAATSFLLYSAWSNSTSNILSLSRVITPAAGSAYRMFITDMSKVESDAQNFTGTPSNQVSFYMYGSKIASNVDISVDYIAIMPRPVLLITGGTVATTGFVVKGFSAYHSASGYISFPLNTIGDAIEFAPNKFNHFQCYFCPDGTVDPVTTYQATFSAIYITPRWALL